MDETFGELLKRHRTAAGFSQEQLAELAGVSADAISSLERGSRRAPQKATLSLLLATLALNDGERLEIEEAAKHARTRGAFQGQDLANNLPPRLTSFVDRERERAEIRALLRSNRLVTVVGTGGAGKTRCAIEIAAELLDRFGDGVWLAELAPISDATLVSTVIARALSVQQAPDRPIGDKLLAYLKRKRLLLILDNCEHVIDKARRVVAAILRDCPDVRVLATSRESLAIAGEQSFRMPSLPAPSTSELLSAEEMSHYGAVRLFNDRAASVDNRFTLTVESAPYVAEICRRLDGIPLAIELTAARVKALSPKQLAQRLDERFRVLTVGDRSALPRHQTMRALIDWSYDLLSDDERRLFRKLSIFAGGFTLGSVTACIESGEDEIAVLELLSSLVDKSLVQTEAVQGSTRYRLLESMRQYAGEKLRDAGEEENVAYMHARAFLGMAEHLFDVWEITSDREWYAQAEPELENFRCALSWAFGARGDLLLGQQLTAALRRVWYSFGPAEGRRWAQIARERVSEDTPAAVMAALDFDEAYFAVILRQFKTSVAAAEQALIHYRQLADSRAIAVTESLMGRAQVFLGEVDEGEKGLTHALEAARSLGMRRLVIATLESLGVARQAAGDLSGARQRYSEALADARSIGAERRAAHIAMNLAETEFRGGDAAEALSLADEALPVLRVFGDTHHIADALYNTAAYLVALHRYDEARSASRDAIVASRDAQFSVGLAFALQHLAAIAASRPAADVPVIEDRLRAARLLGYVDARLAALDGLRQYTEQQEYDAMISALRDALGKDGLSKHMLDGSSWSEDQAVAEAMLI